MSGNKRERTRACEEEEERNIFTNSKKILRSPNYRYRHKENQEGENKMEIVELLKEIKDIREHMARKDELMCDLMKEIKEIREDMKKKDEKMLQIMQEIRDLKSESKKNEVNWNIDRKKIKNKLEKLEAITEKNEKEKRKLNIVIKGLSTNQVEQKDELDRIFREKMGIENKIKQTKTVGRIEGRKIIVAEMAKWEDKMEILEKKKYLQGTNIFIENDLTQEERRIQAEIRAVAREKKSKGNNVKIGYQKLNINGNEYKWSKDDDGLIPSTPTTKN